MDGRPDRPRCRPRRIRKQRLCCPRHIDIYPRRSRRLYCAESRCQHGPRTHGRLLRRLSSPTQHSDVRAHQRQSPRKRMARRQNGYERRIHVAKHHHPRNRRRNPSLRTFRQSRKQRRLAGAVHDAPPPRPIRKHCQQLHRPLLKTQLGKETRNSIFQRPGAECARGIGYGGRPVALQSPLPAS